MFKMSKDGDLKLMRYWFNSKTNTHHIQYSTKIDNFYNYYKTKGYMSKTGELLFIVNFRRGKQLLCSRVIHFKNTFCYDLTKEVENETVTKEI